jgi:hypothetical protein
MLVMITNISVAAVSDGSSGVNAVSDGSSGNMIVIDESRIVSVTPIDEFSSIVCFYTDDQLVSCLLVKTD